MQGRISEANDTFLGMIRRTRAEMEAGILTSQSMATPEWLFGAEARRDRFKDEGTMGPLEREWVLSDGSRLHSLFFVTRLEDSGKALCMLVDATDLKQARRQLHAVETRYKKLFDSNIVGIAVVDGNQVFVEANDTFLRMVGYDRMDLSAGRLTSYALRRPDAEREHRAAEARMQGTGRMLPQETVYVRKDGSMIPVFRGVTRLDEADRYLIIAIDLSVLRATQTTDTPQESSIPSQPS
jgi:PAS domain S-box-containing protein